MAIVLFDKLDGTPQTGGTWTDVSTADPSPAAPGTYNGSIDLDAYAPGIYAYDYTVEGDEIEDTKRVTINWQGIAQSRLNDTCSTAQRIGGTIVAPVDVSWRDTNLGTCVVGAPTLSEFDLPAGWNEDLLSGDLWYIFTAPVQAYKHEVVIFLDGTVYTGGASTFYAQVFTQMPGQDCDSMMEVSSGFSPTGQLLLGVPIAAESLKDIRLRVLSKKGTEGTYDVNITVAEVDDGTTANALGTYCSDAEAIADGLVEGDAYILCGANIYGMPGGLLKRVYGDTGTYDSDAQAGTFGVAIGDEYTLSDTNIYGVPGGLKKIRIV